MSLCVLNFRVRSTGLSESELSHDPKKKAPPTLERDGAFRRGKKPGKSPQQRAFRPPSESICADVVKHMTSTRWLRQYRHERQTDFRFAADNYTFKPKKSSEKTNSYRSILSYLAFRKPASIAGDASFSEPQRATAIWANNLKLLLLPLPFAVCRTQRRGFNFRRCGRVSIPR